MTTPQIPASYEELARMLGAVTDAKNKAYGDSFDRAGGILQILYPNGVQPAQYTDMLALVRILDKLSRIAAGHDGFQGESAFNDLVGYGLLGAMRRLREQAEREQAARAAQDKEATSHDPPF
jgi:hypothetical protein